MMDSKDMGNAAAVIDAMTKLHGHQSIIVQDPHTDDGVGIPLIVVPSGMSVHDPKRYLDQWLDAPRHLVGKAFAETFDSFCDLVLRHKRPETTIWAGSDDMRLEAIFDYHTQIAEGAGSKPAFCKHRLSYAFPETPAFTAWKSSQNWKSKTDFARFLDERRYELVDPLDITEEDDAGNLKSPAPDSIVADIMRRSRPRAERDKVRPANVFANPGDIMVLVESMGAARSKKVKSTTTDQFGNVCLTVEVSEKVETTEGIPSLFLVELTPFHGGEKAVLPVRIHATMDRDLLVLRTEILGIEKLVEMAFEKATKEAGKRTGCPVFRGTPEA